MHVHVPSPAFNTACGDILTAGYYSALVTTEGLYSIVYLQEYHLQRAVSAQQVYGTAEALVIPVPDIGNIGDDRYSKLYKPPQGEFKPPKQYVHVQGL